MTSTVSPDGGPQLRKPCPRETLVTQAPITTNTVTSGPTIYGRASNPGDLGLDVLAAALVRDSPDGITLMGTDRRYLYANPAACQMIGYPLESLVGRDFLADVPECSRQSALAYFDNACKGKVLRGPHVVRRPDGSELPVEATATMVRLRKRLIAVVLRDISERLTQQRRAAALAQATASVVMNDSIDATVQSLAECAMNGTQALAAYVTFGDEDDLAISVGAAGLPDGFREAIRLGGWVRAFVACHGPSSDQRVVVFADGRQQLEKRARGAPVTDSIRSLPWQATAFAPLTYRGAIVGLLGALYREGELPSEAETTFLATLADQAAIAAANAKLIAVTQEKAALEERQRLARELHDSLSQALFGIQLGARRARELVERDNAGAAQQIDYTLKLAEAGQAEMRALIFELRPESLEAEGLVLALERQVEVLRTRYNIAASAIADREPITPLEVKQALYRIVQEALQNTVKHARARHVDVHVEARDGTVVLAVQDDGVGFDPEVTFPGHLGLHTMHERAQGVGGSLEVVSTPGRGTRIVVSVPSPGNGSTG
jgi:PAS domain S-box-containing protein